jgi:hypothetical protein
MLPSAQAEADRGNEEVAERHRAEAAMPSWVPLRPVRNPIEPESRQPRTATGLPPPKPRIMLDG